MTRAALPNNSTTEQRQQSQQPKSFDKLSNASIRMFCALKEMKKNAGDEEDEAEKSLLKLTSNLGTERTFAAALLSMFAGIYTTRNAEKTIRAREVNEPSGSICFCSVEYYERCKQEGWWSADAFEAKSIVVAS